MKTYKADIGSWEHGRSVSIEAKDPQEAYGIALKLLEGNNIIVQILDGKHYVYDYMNGFYP